MRQLSNVARVAITFLLAVSHDAMALSPAREFNIAAGDMKMALDRYAAQSGVQLLYSVAEVDGLVGKAVKGKMAPEAALSLLLQGTPLQIMRGGDNALLIYRPATPAPARTVPKVSLEPPNDPATVIVSGLRTGPESARDRKRDSDAIVDAIVADDIGRLPDQNAGQAAQRIPGVQVVRYLEEGGAFTIRGLRQSKVLLNGLEVYGAKAQSGEYNGRNLDLEDVSAEVLAGVDVSKSSSASDIEGGLGGTLNIRTRQPFDAKGSMASVAVKATNYQMAPGFASKTLAQASGLVSQRWQTDAGEMGVLVNVAHAGSVFGLTEDELERPQLVANYAGSGRAVTLPIGMFTGNGHNGERARDTYVAAFQWRPAANVSLYANHVGVNYLLDQRFQTARFYVGAPTTSYTLWGDRNSDGSDNLRSGTFTGNTMSNASVVGNEGRNVRLYDIGGKWDNGNGDSGDGVQAISVRLSHTDTAVRNTLLEWGMNASVPLMRLEVNEGSPSHLSVSGIDLADPASYRPAYLLSIAANGTQENTAAVVDANYRFGHPVIQSADFGLRVNDYTRRTAGFVHLYCIDGCHGDATLAAADPALLHQVPAAQSREVGPYPTFSSDAVRRQVALRALYGLPAVDANMPEYDQLNHEKTTAAYVKFNYTTDVGGKPVSGNVGLRYVGTALHGASYGANAAGALVLLASDSTRHDVLPSFNATIRLRDDLLFRLGASKTMGQVNFAHLSAAVRISNPVQHDAQAGNPDLMPYTSRNADWSLEHYFGVKGMAAVGMFYKLVSGLIQTAAETRMINGEEYHVATFRQAGLARIKGIEFAYQQFFDRLPAPFNGLGLQANCLFVNTQAPSSVAGRSVPLLGLSKNSCNLAGIYERGKFKARLAYNHRGSLVATTSSSGAQGVPVFARPFGTLDFSIAYDISKHLSLVLDGANITGARIEQHYGSTHNQMNYVPLNKRYGAQMRYVF
ncbi:TonB-dependent receptor [Duganella sp. FT92W]|uniref:TonB-dependent receptor n=1 Tax=Pseudoduganella rivuli TaxID=2666085 RepID=A0A7X2IHU9_9BURK|nr:TonB-dependent receptor [Pseudoduganella rivuli]MRV70302.1 TonB-dependent receptor [Pseudoduganella rivuli]